MATSTKRAAPSRGEEGKAARRTRVIEVAMLMAREGGYDAVQMREVAERADVSLGTIYRYFKSKDDLLLAGLVGWVGILRRRIESEPVQGDNPAERLSSVLSEAAGAAVGATTLMGALITALSTTDPTAAEYKLAVESEVRQLIVAALRDDPSIDAEGVSRVIGHVWLSAISRWVGGLAPVGSVEEELRHAVRMLVGNRVVSGT
jgi:AcrR family transcriptional regulator